MTPLRSHARQAIRDAWARAVEGGALPGTEPDSPLPEVEVERPANPEHGDLATSLALKLARPYRRAPLQIAEAIAAELRASAFSLFVSVDVAAPGFVNLRFADGPLEDLVASILDKPSEWGRVRATQPEKINVEFVSANPTGPLTVGNARGAFVGDLLSRVLEAAGHEVTREYYFNDSGARSSGSASRCSPCARASRCPRTATTATTSVTSRGDLPRDLAKRPRREPDRRLDRRGVGVGKNPRRHRAQPGEPRRPLRRVDERGLAAHRRLGHRGIDGLRDGRSDVRAGRRDSGSARPRTATTRTASSSARTVSQPTSRRTSAT